MNAPTLALQHRIFSHFPNIAFNVVALAASAGGVLAVSTVLSALPADFPAAILVVQHLSPTFPSKLPEVWGRCTALQVKRAEIGDILRPGVVYVAVPDRHLLVHPNGTLLLSDAPRMNFVRPAADKLFMSAAATYQSRATAVVLTGNQTDGALGALTIKKHGGTVIAQDKSTSEYFGMPAAAIATGKIQCCPCQRLPLHWCIGSGQKL